MSAVTSPYGPGKIRERERVGAVEREFSPTTARISRHLRTTRSVTDSSRGMR